jgi:hypothetical protein
MTRFFKLILPLLFTTSCSQGVLSPISYAKWVSDSDNGLNTKKKIGHYEFSLQYKPLDYVVLLEEGVKVPLDKLESRKKELEGMQYFTFRITSLTEDDMLRTDQQDENEYYQRLEYFVSSAQDDISLIDGGDTLPCAIYHFERNYGLAPFNNIVLGFEKSGKNAGDKTLVYNDNALGAGPVLLTIKGNAVKQIPQLAIK